MTEFDQYKHGLEIVPIGLIGWAVFTGTDGESPNFYAFYAREDDARHAIEVRSDEPGEEGHARLFDATYVLAILTKRGVIASNSDHKSHIELRDAYEKAVLSER